MHHRLKSAMLQKQNLLKFAVNGAQTLSKQGHVGKICEAFHKERGQWLAGLVQDFDPSSDQVEVTFIGIAQPRTKLPKKYVTVLDPVSPELLFVGAKCSAIREATGMWAGCSVRKVI